MQQKNFDVRVARILWKLVIHFPRIAPVEDQLNSISDEIREEMKKQVNDLREEIKLLLRPGHTLSHPADSCADILEYNNQSPSGYYWVQNSKARCVVK